MKQFIAFGKRTIVNVCLLQISVYAAFAQLPSSTARCQVSASPVQVRAEGLTERLGDVVLQCSGANPGTVFSGNFTLYFPVSVTNRVDANNQTRDAVISVDLGSGFVPTAIAGQVSGNRRDLCRSGERLRSYGDRRPGFRQQHQFQRNLLY